MSFDIFYIFDTTHLFKLKCYKIFDKLFNSEGFWGFGDGLCLCLCSCVCVCVGACVISGTFVAVSVEFAGTQRHVHRQTRARTRSQGHPTHGLSREDPLGDTPNPRARTRSTHARAHKVL